MFKFLKEKISGFFGKKAEEDPKKEVKKKADKKVSEKKAESKKPDKKIDTKKSEGKKAAQKSVEEKLKKKSDKIEKEAPVEFNVGRKKYEVDLEKLEEDIKESEKKPEEKEEVKEIKEKKKGFFGFFGRKDDQSDEAGRKKDEVEQEVEELKEEFADKKDEVEERAEELEEAIEAEIIEKAEEKEESLEVKQEVKEKKGFFGFLAEKLTTSELKAEDFDSAFDEFEFTLLENNVALGVVDAIRASLKKDLVGKRYGSKEVEGKILLALKRAIDSLLIEPPLLEDLIRAKKDYPFVILFFGINGSGKTTSIAKLAWKLKREGFDPVLAAGDTFRAASIEQLETHAQRIGVEIVKSEYGKDPASVAFDAISHAKKMKKKVVLIDTAGRMYTKSNLMKEMEKIVHVSKPDLKIFVGESITGNDATEQARMFAETAGIDGIILSKADVDEKAGTILSVSHVTGKPIFFLGVGQEYGDLERFSKSTVLKGLGLE